MFCRQNIFQWRTLSKRRSIIMASIHTLFSTLSVCLIILMLPLYHIWLLHQDGFCEPIQHERSLNKTIKTKTLTVSSSLRGMLHPIGSIWSWNSQRAVDYWQILHSNLIITSCNVWNFTSVSHHNNIIKPFLLPLSMPIGFTRIVTLTSNV